MRRRRFSSCVVACLLTCSFAAPLLARGQAWALLGSGQVDLRQDHSSVQVTRRDCFFRTIQLRVSEAVFFDRLVAHYANGTSEELSIGERIFPGGRNYVIQLDGDGRLLESVELWYYKESGARNPSVSLYGIAPGAVDFEDAQRMTWMRSPNFRFFQDLSAV